MPTYAIKVSSTCPIARRMSRFGWNGLRDHMRCRGARRWASQRSCVLLSVRAFLVIDPVVHQVTWLRRNDIDTYPPVCICVYDPGTRSRCGDRRQQGRLADIREHEEEEV
jgi:hypothetical protein